VSILTPKQRWRATKTDRWILGVGVGLIAGGLIVVLSSTNDPLWTFAADALLTVGAAIALVGIIFRVQLDIQDELDDAQQARTRFEAEMRSEVSLIDRRVTEALSRLPADDNVSRAQEVARTDELIRELGDARGRVSDLEARLATAGNRVKARNVSSLLTPIWRSSRKQRESSSGGETTAARLARVVRGVLLVLGVAAAATVSIAAFWFIIFNVVPESRYSLIVTTRFRLQVGLEVGGLLIAIAGGVMVRRPRSRAAAFAAYFVGMNAVYITVQLIVGRFPHTGT
jgi:hypothetical protein